MMNFKQIASYDNFMLANMTLGLLQENEINCHLKDEHIVTIDPLLNPAVGGIKLMVDEADFDKAQELIKEAEDAYIRDIPCPNCKSNSLVLEEKINKPDNFWDKLKNQIAYGQSETYSKKYRCQNCKNLFSELPPSF
ncbi:MAG TPA: DUF2007 domain-containing protein [Ferruginibacter sp.]|nr:DUF2007 domain-containing protein [Ferruginibacter sp.]